MAAGRLGAALALAVVGLAGAARAADGDIWTRDGLGGDLGGLRPWLDGYGVRLGLEEQADVLGNPAGGRRRQVDAEGVATASLDVTPPAWRALHLHVTALQLHGRNLTADTLGALQAASGIQSLPATRLWEAWAEWSGGGWALRAGKLALDQSFMISDGASHFLNASLGWPVVPTSVMYAGGAAYPLAATGAMLRWHDGGWHVRLAVVDDNPTGGSFALANPAVNLSGTRFSLRDGVLAVAELRYVRASRDWPGTYRLGGWGDGGWFPDRRYAADGTSLAGSDLAAAPRRHRGDAALYAVVDQGLASVAGRRVSAFLRVVDAPAEDRNLVTLGINAGLELRAPFAARPHDMTGLGFGLARLGAHAYALERDRLSAGEAEGRVSRDEKFVELTYRARLARWWTLQPDLQVILDPAGPTFPFVDGAPAGTVGGITAGGGAKDRHAGSSVVLGVRTDVRF